MRSTIGVFSAAALLAIVIASTTTGSVLPPKPPPAKTDLQKQGRHVLELAGGCGCHGPNFGGWRKDGPEDFPRAIPFGERFVGPFGEVPAANITQDVTDGVGGWTDDQLVDAITKGLRPDGSRLSPIMPYISYSGMSRSDVMALVAYMRCLRPVKNDVPERTLKQPVPEISLAATAPETRPAGGAELGGYLVRNVSACADCHGGDEKSGHGDELIGKVMKIDGEMVTVPSLMPARGTAIGTWSESEIATYLRTGSRPDGGLAQSAMAGLIVTSFSHLTAPEAHAIAMYLKSPPRPSATPP